MKWGKGLGKTHRRGVVVVAWWVGSCERGRGNDIPFWFFFGFGFGLAFFGSAFRPGLASGQRSGVSRLMHEAHDIGWVGRTLKDRPVFGGHLYITSLGSFSLTSRAGPSLLSVTWLGVSGMDDRTGESLAPFWTEEVG